jgi:hypothetical protein
LYAIGMAMRMMRRREGAKVSLSDANATVSVTQGE